MNGDPDSQKICTKGDIVKILSIEKLGQATSRLISTVERQKGAKRRSSRKYVIHVLTDFSGFDII